MVTIDDVKKMNDGFKKERDDLTKKLDLVTKKWVLMDDLHVAVEYLYEVIRLFDNFSETGNPEDIIKKLYKIPDELSSLVMLHYSKVDEIRSKILDFVKSNVPGGVKGIVAIHRRFRIRDLKNEYSDVVSDEDVFPDVSDIIYYLQVIQIWFACNYVMSFGDEKKAVIRNNNIDTDNKVCENINDFAKELANIHGYESFDDMTDDEKYMALTLWRDHIKTSTSNIDE